MPGWSEAVALVRRAGSSAEPMSSGDDAASGNDENTPEESGFEQVVTTKSVRKVMAAKDELVVGYPCLVESSVLWVQAESSRGGGALPPTTVWHTIAFEIEGEVDEKNAPLLYEAAARAWGLSKDFELMELEALIKEGAGKSGEKDTLELVVGGYPEFLAELQKTAVFAAREVSEGVVDSIGEKEEL